MKKNFCRRMIVYLLLVIVMLCCSCSRYTDENESYTNVSENTKSSNIVTNIKKEDVFDNSKEQYLYYASSHKEQFDEEDNILLWWNWCLADNGIFYITQRQLASDESDVKDGGTFLMGDERLCYISYDSLFALDDIDKMYIGMTEDMTQTLDSIAVEIDISELGNTVISGLTAYNDGVVIFAYEKGSDDTISKRYAAFIEGSLDITIHDITECENHAYNVVTEQGLGTIYNMRYVLNDGDKIYYCTLYSQKSGSTMWFYNEENSDVKVLSLDYAVKNIVDNGKGRAYWIVPNEKELVSIDFTSDDNEMDNIYKFDKNSYINASKDATAMWTQEGIYSFDIENLENIDDIEDTLVPVLEYDRVGIGNGLFDKVRFVGDKNIVAANFASNELTVYCFYESDTLMSDEKIKLKMAVTTSTDNLENMIRTFNKANGMYEVELEVYEDSSTFVTKLLSNDTPDIINTDMTDISIYTSNGCLEDLYTFLNSPGSRIKKDDLLGSLIDTCTYNGKLVTMPTRFYPLALVGGDYFSEYTTWSADEYISLIEKNDRLICPNVLSSMGVIGDIIEIYWCARKDYIIDFENKIVNFTSPEFIRFLEAVSKYDPEKYVTQNAVSNYWRDDSVYLSLIYMMGCKDIMQQEQIMCGQTLVMLGFPTGSYNPDYAAITWSSYAISANSKNKDGAWSFIQYALRYNDDNTPGYSMYLPNLEKMFSNAQNKRYKRDSNYNIETDSDGNPVEDIFYINESGNNPIQIAYRALTDDEVLQVWDVLNHIRILIGSSTPMDEIFWEEIQRMLDGIQTPQQTAAVLQDRFTLMLDEGM